MQSQVLLYRAQADILTSKNRHTFRDLPFLHLSGCNRRGAVSTQTLTYRAARGASLLLQHMHCLFLSGRISFYENWILFSLVNNKDYKLLWAARFNQIYTMHMNNSQPAVYSGYSVLHILKVIQNIAEHPTVCLLLKSILQTISNLKCFSGPW